jgi:hypothetical protein
MVSDLCIKIRQYLYLKKQIQHIVFFYLKFADFHPPECFRADDKKFGNSTQHIYHPVTADL